MEVNAFTLLSSDRDGADRLIERSMEKITQALQQIGLGGFQLGSRSADALSALNKAHQLDQQVRDAIAGNDLTTASQLLIDATTEKARAELFLEGHNPKSAPLPDGLGGYDFDDPDFSDGFVSGDVDGWATGNPIVRRPPNNTFPTDDTFPTNDTPDPNNPFGGTCNPDPTTGCLDNNRFEVFAPYSDGVGSGQGRVESTSDDTVILSFPFNDGELTVKVLNRCDLNNHFWVFYGATTNVEYTLRVTDTRTNQTRSYDNPLGGPSPAVTDTQAFATCP